MESVADFWHTAEYIMAACIMPPVAVGGVWWLGGLWRGK